MSTINQSQRAARGWDALIQLAKERKTARYKEFGNEIGIHHRAVRYVLDLIQTYCLEQKLPPLTILVVNQTGKPGEGFIAWDTDDIEEGLRQVYNFNWDIQENPFDFARHGLTQDDIVASLINEPEKSGDIYAKVKVRGTAQVVFREALLEAYNYQCAFCGLSFVEALEASHIIPWTDAAAQERMDVRNGLLLCAIHHHLFDNGLITIDEGYHINYCDPREEDDEYSKYDRLMTTALHGKKMILPEDKKLVPLQEYLEWHRGEE